MGTTQCCVPTLAPSPPTTPASRPCTCAGAGDEGAPGRRTFRKKKEEAGQFRCLSTRARNRVSSADPVCSFPESECSTAVALALPENCRLVEPGSLRKNERNLISPPISGRAAAPIPSPRPRATARRAHARPGKQRRHGARPKAVGPARVLSCRRRRHHRQLHQQQPRLRHECAGARGPPRRYSPP